MSRDSSDVAALATGTGEGVVVERADLQGALRRIGFSVVASPSPPAAAPSWDAELDGHAALCRMPRTSSGEPDVGSLSSIPLVTDDQLAECERLLQSLPGIREGAVVPCQWPRPESPLHLDQLLPRQLRAESDIAEERAAVSEPLPMRATELPWASVDGEALREPPPFETLVDVMLAAVSRSRDDDLTFVNFDGTVVRQSLADLLQSAKRILGGLLASGLEPGCRVVLQLDSNAELLASFWACLLGGCPPVIVPVPPSYVEPNRGSDQLAHVVTSLDRPWLVTNQSRVADLTAWTGERRLACAGVLAFEQLQTFSPSERVHRPKPSDTAFFSTSSGSTGQPKCVGLTHRGLIDRAAGTNQLCEHSCGDVILNWLPLDHIGSISDWHLRCLLVGCRMVYVPKEFVISEPLRWLDLIHAHRLTHSWAPNFAYSLIRDALAKQPAAALVGRWDLSCVVGLLTAGEAVSPKVVSEFLALLKPFGFAETAIRPAFGMAELGSGVTYSVPTQDEPLRFHTLARSTLETGPVRVPADHPDAITFTDLGRPIPGVSLRIVDDERRVVREETIGHVHVRGTAVMAGYYGNPAANAVLLDDGWFDTGDLGFLTDGRLVLTGRAKDVIIVNGANYYCGEIEEAAESVPGVAPSFTAACAPRRPDRDREQLVVFFCPLVTRSAEVKKAITRIRQAVVRQVGVKPDYILPVSADQIPKTAIGKLQRSQLTRQFEAGEFDDLARATDILMADERTLPNWFYRRSWQAATLIDEGERPPQTAVVIGNGSVLDALSQELRAAGTRTIQLEPGAGFSELGVDRYRIAPERRDDWDLLLESFMWQDIAVDHWIAGDESSLQDDGSLPASSSSRQFALVRSLLAALAARHDGERSIRVTALTLRAESVFPEEISAVESAPLRGLLRAAAQEHAWLSARLIDDDGFDSPAISAARLFRELCASRELQAAYRQGRRFVPRLERVEFRGEPAAMPLKRSGVYVLAGAKNEYGDCLAEFLRQRLNARVVELEDDGGSAGDETELIEDGGRRNRYRAACAMENPASLDRRIETIETQLQGRVDGVFFLPAAFSDDPNDDAIRELAAVRLTRQILAWHQWLSRRPETLFVSVASLDGLMGGRGRRHEAEALAVLEACQRSRRAGAAARAVWMEPADDRFQKRAPMLKAGGYLEAGPTAWLRSLLAAIAWRADDWAIGLDGRHPSIRRLMTNGDFLYERPTAFYVADETFDERQFDSVAWPRDMFGTPIALNFAALEELPRDERGDVDRARLRKGIVRPPETTAAPRTEIEQRVAAMFRDVLGLSAIGLNDNFFELGGHSVLLMQLHGRLQQAFGPKLQLVDMFRLPTVAALAQALGDDSATAVGPSEGRNRAGVRRQRIGGAEGESAERGVAVIGMACRFPGANSIEEFWRNLRNGVESITFFTEDEALAAGVDPERVRDSRYVKAAPIIPHVEEFDAELFGYTPREARLLDPQQRVFLECAWEALEDAGFNPRSCPASIGVFAGAVMNTYLVNHLVPNREFAEVDDRSEVLTLDSMSGFQLMVANDKDYLTTRVSYKLNLRGPSVNVQTACSTSLVAVHLAAQAVANGECDMALAGGVSIKVPQETGYLYQPDVIVSPDGHCRAFDARAEGTIFGNGSGVVLLKRLDEAFRDGDHVYAVIRGSALNNDGGNKLGYMAPSQEGQAEVVAEALAMANVPPESIQFIEAHGTGTALGDPIEIAGLAQGLGTSVHGYCAVGSVKTNVGHLQIASGIAGFIKAALAVHYGEIPPTLHFETPNPKIGFERTPFFVNNRLLPWPKADHPRRAGVNSLGIGGANCHVILEQAPVPSDVVAASGGRPRHVLQLSAANETALRELTRRYVAWIEQHPEASPADVCYTANIGRIPLECRLAVAASSLEEFRSELTTRLNDASRPLGAAVDLGRQRRVAFLFTGQGTQFPGMARTLFETQPTFRRAMEECAALADTVLPQPLLASLFGDDGLRTSAASQTALFAVEYSLSQMWMSWGIQPAVMIGHSLGEYAAACVAGVMTLAEALNLVATRGRLTDGLSSDGGMAAVGLSHAEVERRLAAGDSSSPNPAGARHAINGASLRKRLSIAAVNAPDQVVLSGDAAALRDFVEPLAREGVFVHWLEVSHAFHSRHVEPMLAEFGRALERVVWRSPQIPVISNLTGRPADDEIATPEYWRRHLRETVRFQQGMEAAGALADVFLEIGPKPVLLGFGRKILTDRDAAAWLPSLRPPLDDWTTLLDSLCSLAMSGVEIDWENFDREYPRRRVSLPTYPFQRKRYWIERPQGGRATIPSKSTPRLDASSRRHPLLHQRWRSPLIAETVFEAEISLEESPFIADHRFFGTAIMPATAYLEMGLCAAGNLFGAGPRALMNVEFSEVLPLEEQKRQRLQLVAGKPEGRRAPFRVISIQEETATANDCRLHVQGELGRADDIKVEAWNPPTVERIGERCPRRISREEFYEAIREHDVFMGEQFQVVDECFVGDGELWGRVRIPPGIADRSSFDVPPPILDACLQLIPGGVPYDVEMTLLPVGIERLAFHGALGDAGLWCRAVLRTDGATGDKVVVADAWLIDDAGRCCVSLEGLQYRRVMKDSLRRRIQPHSKNLLFRTAWRPLSLASTVAIEESPKRWLIVGGDTDVAARLIKLLTQEGHECVTAAYGETFRRLGACRFELPWNDRAAWDQLLSETAGIGSRPYDGVIHLVGLDDGCGSSDGDVAGVLRRGCESLLYLAQGLLSGGWSNLPPLTIVTRGGQAVNGSADVTRPTSTALWGFGRALEMEHSEWACLRIDLGSNDAEGDASRIVAEVMSGNSDRESAYRDGERFVPRVEPLDRREYRLPEIRGDRTYLITGGSGALGLKTAHWLIEQGARHLVLASRFGVRNAEEGILAQWRAHGVGATSICCDVSREEDVARLFAQIDASMPALAGIIHAAGVLDDGALENLDWRRFERVLAAKVFGAWHLHRLSEGRTLDFFVCYSSIASVLGSAGQANYAAANAFLDGLAHLRQSRGLRTLSVQWGPWAGGGMAEGLSETIRRRHEQRGLILIDDAEAFDALADLWQRGAAEGLVLAVDWERYRRQFVGGRPQPLLEIVAPAVSESSPEKDAFRRRWTEAADYERRALVEELTRRLVGAAVGFDEIGADDSFFDLGLDSLASVQLRNDLQEYLGLELPATLIFMHPTLDQLNRYLTEDVLALDISMASGRVNGDNFIADNIAIPKEDANSLEVLSDGELAERLSTMLAALQSESA